MKFPEALKKGDNVFVFCPSSPIFPEDLEKCEKAIKDLGFNPVFGKSLRESYGGYIAGSPEIRVADLHEAFSREDIKGIICAKGGYSASLMLDKIDYELIRNNPKVFVGYSDVTNLHVVFNQKCDLGTYHGPMVKSNMFENFNDYTKNSFLEALENEKWIHKNPDYIEISVLETGNNNFDEVEGIITGGNLAIIATTLGTWYEIDVKDKILFLEDVEEPVGSIHRMLTHLKNCGKLNECKAIIFGNFADCGNKYDENYGVMEMLKDFFKDYDKPVIYNFESGHAKPFLATVPLGATCKINVKTKEISFEK